MLIVDFDPNQEKAIEQAASLLVEVFSEHWPDAWPTMAAALKTVRDSYGSNGIGRAAIDDVGNVIGWIGGLSEYNG